MCDFLEQYERHLRDPQVILKRFYKCERLLGHDRDDAYRYAVERFIAEGYGRPCEACGQMIMNQRKG